MNNGPPPLVHDSMIVSSSGVFHVSEGIPVEAHWIADEQGHYTETTATLHLLTIFFVWMLHGSTKFVVRAVALLSAKQSEKRDIWDDRYSNKLCMYVKQHSNLKETRDKPRKGKKTASQRVSEATA